jgi:hypothetical protein
MINPISCDQDQRVENHVHQTSGEWSNGFCERCTSCFTAGKYEVAKVPGRIAQFSPFDKATEVFSTSDVNAINVRSPPTTEAMMQLNAIGVGFRIGVIFRGR